MTGVLHKKQLLNFKRWKYIYNGLIDELCAMCILLFIYIVAIQSKHDCQWYECRYKVNFYIVETIRAVCWRLCCFFSSSLSLILLLFWRAIIWKCMHFVISKYVHRIGRYLIALFVLHSSIVKVNDICCKITARKTYKFVVVV